MLKKLSIIITTGLLLFTIVTPVTADDSYVPSIQAKDTVVITGGEGIKGEEATVKTESGVVKLEYTSAEDGCNVWIVLTPYSKKETIENTKSKNEIDYAWEEVKNASKVVDYAPIMKEVSKKKGIDENELTTKDLFDITVYHSGSNHNKNYDHDKVYNIQLTTEALENFVALLHYDSTNDKWEQVADAKVTGDNKDILTFTFDSCSPFAIIVKTKEGQNSTGNGGTTDKDSSVPNTAVRVVETIRNASVASYFLWILLVILAIVVTYILNNHKRHEKKR